MKRRDFLRLSASMGAGMAAGVPGRLLAAESTSNKSPNEKLNIACVGSGGRGNNHVRAFSEENIVGMCDVDSQRASEMFKKFERVPKFKDYRVMLDQLGDKIDAVSVATPDHAHHQIAKAAMQMGKHVYVEKPLTRTIPESRELLELSRRNKKIVTQMGNQGTSSPGQQRMKEWIDAGMIGDVKAVDVWTNRPVWPQGMKQLPKGQRVPDNLAWGLWLAGIASYPYHEDYLPFAWRGWYAFGTGSQGDMGCHQLNAPYYALELGKPETIYAEVEGGSDVAWPEKSLITYKFPARDGKPPVTLRWFDGGKQPERPEELGEERELGETGTFFYGEKATMMSDTYGHSFRVIPESKMQEMAKNQPEKTLPRAEGDSHFDNFIRGCKGETETVSNFEYAVPLTEICLTGALAQQRPNKELAWDDSAGRVANDSEANKFVEGYVPEYRF